MNDPGVIQWPKENKISWNFDETIDCNWYIILPESSIMLQWITFDIDFTIECSINYVEIMDDENLLGRYVQFFFLIKC